MLIRLKRSNTTRSEESNSIPFYTPIVNEPNYKKLHNRVKSLSICEHIGNDKQVDRKHKCRNQ